VSSQPIALTAARHYVTRSDPCPRDMRLADFSAALCPRDVINQHQQFADPMPRPFILCQAVTFGGLRHASARATALAHQIRSVKFTLALAANPCRWTLVDCLGSGPWPGSATTEQRHSPGRRRSNRMPPGTLRVLVITMGRAPGSPPPSRPQGRESDTCRVRERGADACRRRSGRRRRTLQCSSRMIFPLAIFTFQHQAS